MRTGSLHVACLVAVLGRHVCEMPFVPDAGRDACVRGVAPIPADVLHLRERGAATISPATPLRDVGHLTCTPSPATGQVEAP